MNIKQILKKYDPSNITIGVLGGHSALDVCAGATKYGFDTVVVCQKGREKTYAKYYKRRKSGTGPSKALSAGQAGGQGEKGCVGNIILVDKFSDIVRPSVQKELQKLNTVFVHNRYFWVYCDFAKIEKDFEVPIFGLRKGVKLEERDQPLNQYDLLKKAGIRIPKIIREGSSKMNAEALSKALDKHFGGGEGKKGETSAATSKPGKALRSRGGPLIAKVNEAIRSYERAFFVFTSEASFKKQTEKMLKKGQITKEGLDKCVIEEFIIGAHINLNFFYSSLSGELELMGTDTRRQTNLDGFLRLDCDAQKRLLSYGYSPKMIETGHYAVTMKESLIEKAFEIGEKFVKTMKKEVAPGIIGPFALQGAVVAEDGKEEFVIFDVSMRIPGSPGTRFTPYSGYLYGDCLSYGERIAMEIKQAVEKDKLSEILT